MKYTTKRVLSLVLVLAMLFSMFTAAVSAKPAASATEIYDLKVNDLYAPVGLDENPSFSWKMKSDAIGAAQTEYSIVVTDPSGAEAWNTGWVKSDDSVAIPYAGNALAASTEYTVNVAVKDQAGAEASAATTFETGLLDEGFGAAKWIGYNTPKASESTNYTIDFDFIIDAHTSGICFGMKDTGTFNMWQLNVTSGAAQNQVLLRPHFKNGGNWTAYPGGPGNVKAIDVSAVTGTPAQATGKQMHMRITVNGSNIKTYLGADKDNVTLVNSYDHTAIVPLYNLGFRQSVEDTSEICRYDNILVTDNTDGSVIYSEDFSDGASLEGGNSACATVVGGMLRLETPNEQVYILRTKTAGMEGANANSLPVYRKAFDGTDVVSAKLYTSGLGVYESYINGQRVGRKMDDGSVQYDELKPGFTTASKRMSYSSYDITWMLQEGENVLSSIVTTGWWHGGAGQMTQGNELAYIAKLVLTDAEGNQKVITTDESWKTAKVAPVLASTGIYEGEDFDANVNLSWMNPGYNDNNWGNAAINNEFKGELTAWHGSTIQVREDLERAPQSLTVYQGAVGAAAGQHGKINVIATYTDGQDITLEPGQTLLVNFGQNLAGWEAFEVTAAAGTKINVEHGEWVNDNNGATARGNDGPEGSIYNANYRSARCQTNYIAKEGRQSWHPSFTFYGFQYVAFTADKTVTFHDISAQVVTSVQGDTAAMVTSNADLNQLISNAFWGMYSNYLAVPTDCPQRDERMGWTADTQVFSMTGMFLGDNKAFLEKAMEDIRDSQYTSGGLNGAYPDVAPNTGYGGDGAYGWADCGIILPYNLYMMYGDTTVITDSWASMQTYMDVYLANQPYGGNNTYCDWLCYESESGEAKNMLSLAFHCWDALMMVEMANAIGDTAAAEKYQGVYETHKAQYQNEFVNADGTIHTGTQANCIYALYCDLLPSEDSYNKVVDQLVTNIESNGNKLQTGFLGTALIMNTLVKIGRADIAYKLLLQDANPSWLYSVDQGATSFWERWNTYTIATGFGDVGMNSFNHYAYGAVIGWMFKEAVGIGFDPLNPGFKHIVLTPNPDQMVASIDASYESAYGTIVSNMSYEGGSWYYDAKVPANTTATIRLPYENLASLTVNGKAYTEVTKAADGLVFVEAADGVATFDAVAGTFNFVSSVAEKYAVTLGVNAADAAMSPVEVEVTVDGETTMTRLPATLSLPEGAEVSVKATPMNYVDYAVTEWVQGETVTEGDTVTFTVTGETALTVNTEKVIWVSLATGKTVTVASQVNNDWHAKFLADGILSAEGGTNGWSSVEQQKQLTFSSEVWAYIDLGAATEFNRVHIYPRFLNGSAVNCPVSYTIYTSNNASDWTPVYSITGGSASNGYAPLVAELEKTANARYVKLGVTEVNKGDEHGGTYVQLAEMGVYFKDESACIVNVGVQSDVEGVVPVKATVSVNGEVKATALPTNLQTRVGDVVTVQAELLNTVDYTVTGWSAGTVAEDGTVTYTVAGEADLTMNVAWNGYNSLAVGKDVEGEEVAASWTIRNLIDGKLSYLDGPNGWSSTSQGNNVTVFEKEIAAIIDLGEPMQFNRFHLYPRNLPSELPEFADLVMNTPKAYTIYISNNKTDWTPVYATTEAVQTNGYTPDVVELEAPVTAQYVKLGVTAVHNGDEHETCYVQMSEFGIYSTDDGVRKLTMNVTSDAAGVVPMEPKIYLNGVLLDVDVTLPAYMNVMVGDEITVEAGLLNTVDYSASWLLGEKVVSDNGTVSFTVSKDVTLDLNIQWNGYNSLATGKNVIAEQVAGSWAAKYLTDGKLSYLDGPNGWSTNPTGTTTFAEKTAVIDLGSEMKFNRFHLYPRNLPSAKAEIGVMNMPVAYTISVSDNNADWTTVYATTNGEVTNGFAPVVVELDSLVSGRYVKLSVTAVNQGDENGDPYVQMSEFGVYRTDDGAREVKLALSTDAKDVIPMETTVTINGETAKTLVPGTLVLSAGDVVTLETKVLNTVDYTVTGWSKGGEVLSDNSTLTYTVTDNDTLTVNVKWNGYDSIAQGKPVDAVAVNDDWAAKHLTDGVLSYLGGTNGWSSKSPGKNITTFDEVSAVVDLGEEMAFDRFHIYPRNLPSAKEEIGVMNMPTAYKLYVSSNGSEWTEVFAETDGEVTNGFQPVVVQLDELVYARYVKYGVTAINQGDENQDAYIQLSELGIYKTLEEKPDETVYLEVSADAAAPAGAEEVTFTVSAKNMNGLANAILYIDMPTDLLAEPVVESVEGSNWAAIAYKYENGQLVVSAMYLEESEEKVGCTGDEVLFTIKAKTVEKSGDATVTITAATLSSYVGDDEVMTEVDLTAASATITIEHNKFDLNKDGIVDQLDLTRAQRRYGDEGENLVGDINGDGAVKIDDLIAILMNFTEPLL